MAVIQTLKSAGAATFEGMAGKYCEVIPRVLGQNDSNRVDLIFDQYHTLWR